MAPPLKGLTGTIELTRRLIMQKARRHPDKSGLRPLVSIRFQVLLTRLLGVLFTFPLRYWFTIGHAMYVALADGAASFRQDSSGPALLRIPRCHSSFAYAAFTPFGSPFQKIRLAFMNQTLWSYNPAGLGRRFGLGRVRSPLLAPSLLFSFPPAT